MADPSGMQNLPTQLGYEKYLQTNPNATYEQYTEAYYASNGTMLFYTEPDQQFLNWVSSGSKKYRETRGNFAYEVSWGLLKVGFNAFPQTQIDKIIIGADMMSQTAIPATGLRHDKTGSGLSLGQQYVLDGTLGLAITVGLAADGLMPTNPFVNRSVANPISVSAKPLSYTLGSNSAKSAIILEEELGVFATRGRGATFGSLGKSAEFSFTTPNGEYGLFGTSSATSTTSNSPLFELTDTFEIGIGRNARYAAGSNRAQKIDALIERMQRNQTPLTEEIKAELHATYYLSDAEFDQTIFDHDYTSGPRTPSYVAPTANPTPPPPVASNNPSPRVYRVQGGEVPTLENPRPNASKYLLDVDANNNAGAQNQPLVGAPKPAILRRS